MTRSRGPRRIVCLTEETTETLYLLGEQDRIVGISGYTVRPPEARRDKPRVSAFLSARIERIVELRPDLVVGFSDLQADVAADLVRRGVQVLITNQRSVAEILEAMLLIGRIIGAGDRAQALVRGIEARLGEIRAAGSVGPRPRVYFEEWDEPMISGIRWVSELIGIAGGDDVFPELAAMPLGKDRIIADADEVVRRDPQLILGSWCGKKFRAERVAARVGWQQVAAVRAGQLFEVKSADILQPGPAALTDGVEAIHRRVLAWRADQGLEASA